MQIAHCENHRCRLTLTIPLVVSTLINAYLSEVPELVSSFQRLFWNCHFGQNVLQYNERKIPVARRVWNPILPFWQYRYVTKLTGVGKENIKWSLSWWFTKFSKLSLKGIRGISLGELLFSSRYSKAWRCRGNGSVLRNECFLDVLNCVKAQEQEIMDTSAYRSIVFAFFTFRRGLSP